MLRGGGKPKYKPLYVRDFNVTKQSFLWIITNIRDLKGEDKGQ